MAEETYPPQPPTLGALRLCTQGSGYRGEISRASRAFLELIGYNGPHKGEKEGGGRGYELREKGLIL